jgi:hypothetical protein
MEVIMNRVKFTLIAASLALATTFTLSCSDDDKGGTPSCTLSLEGMGLAGHSACVEASGMTKEKCQGVEGSFSEGCKSGATKKCEDENDITPYIDEGETLYVYGGTFESIECDMILTQMDAYFRNIIE